MDVSKVDPDQALYYLLKTNEAQAASIKSIEKNITDIKVLIATINREGAGNVPAQLHRNPKFIGASGGLSALIVAVLIGLYEFIKAKFIGG